MIEAPEKTEGIPNFLEIPPPPPAPSPPSHCFLTGRMCGSYMPCFLFLGSFYKQSGTAVELGAAQRGSVGFEGACVFFFFGGGGVLRALSLFGYSRV